MLQLNGPSPTPGTAEFRLRRNGFRVVQFIPKFDTRGRMNAEGSKCANTPTPARQPVRRRIGRD
jgi:hypothetical protein